MPSALAIADAAVGACLVGASVVASTRRPESRVGALLGLSGVTWFAGSIFTGALYLHRGPLVHLHLAYPTGRLRGWPSRVTVGIAYATAAVGPWARNDALTIVVAVLVAVTAASVFLPTLGPTRRALLPALGAALAFAVILGFAAVQRIIGWEITDAVRVDVRRRSRRRRPRAPRRPAARPLGAKRSSPGWWSTSAGSPAPAACAAPSPGRSATARSSSATGCPTSGDMSTTPAPPVDVGDLQPGRSATPIEQAGEPLAVLVHDDAVLDDPRPRRGGRRRRPPGGVERPLAGTGPRADRTSRRFSPADRRSRRRAARPTRTGAALRPAGSARPGGRVARRVRADLAAGPTAAQLAALEDELRQARTELDELAQGIHPRALVEGGLALALPKLADVAGVPVHLDVDVDRLPRADRGGRSTSFAPRASPTPPSTPTLRSSTVSVARTTSDGGCGDRRRRGRRRRPRVGALACAASPTVSRRSAAR